MRGFWIKLTDGATNNGLLSQVMTALQRTRVQ